MRIRIESSEFPVRDWSNAMRSEASSDTEGDSEAITEREYKKPKSGQGKLKSSGKEKANNPPDWAKQTGEKSYTD